MGNPRMADEGLCRLDVTVAREASISRSEAARWIAAGRVSVEGHVAATRSMLVAPATPIHIAQGIEPPSGGPGGDAPALEIVYQDSSFVVVNKKAGMVVHPARGHSGVTLTELLVAQGVALAGGAPERPGVVHRLDRYTSGLVMFSCTPEAYTSLAAQLAAHTARRTYWVLVEGRLDEDLCIEAPVGRDPVHRHRMSVGAHGREARTWIYVRERLQRATLLEARLDTGRTHQIRVHMSAIGHPVVGDTTYGAANRGGIGRLALHALKLELKHPVTAEMCMLEATVPDELVNLLVKARQGEAV